MEKNKKMVKKLLKRHEAELKSRLKKNKLSPEQKELIDHELKGMKKFGIDAIGTGSNLFNAGDTVKLTLNIGNKVKIRFAKILLFREDYIIFQEHETNVIFQVLKYNIAMVDLLDIPDDEFYEFLKVDYAKWEKTHEQKGDKSYG